MAGQGAENTSSRAAQGAAGWYRVRSEYVITPHLQFSLGGGCLGYVLCTRNCSSRPRKSAPARRSESSLLGAHAVWIMRIL